MVWHENSLLGLDHCTIKLISAISRFQSRDFDRVFRSNSEFIKTPQRFFRNLAYLHKFRVRRSLKNWSAVISQILEKDVRFQFFCHSCLRSGPIKRKGSQLKSIWIKGSFNLSKENSKRAGWNNARSSTKLQVCLPSICILAFITQIVCKVL